MPDLIDDGTWRETALARMSEAFPTNRGPWPMYRLMAGAHRYAIDYIEQAPVIVLAAAHGNAHVSWSESGFIQEQFRKMCQSKTQLREVMRAYGLPLPRCGYSTPGC
jgi:hypothetical protein